MSFGVIAEDYDRLRSGPPDGTVDWLLPEHCQVAVDLAAGTGLLTRVLVRKVPQVVAVEPDERMAAVLQARSPGVEVLRGTGEAIPMPDASADGVFVSSAWHWMDPERAVPEIGRVLRDGGRFGVIWTSLARDVEWLRDLRRFGRQQAAESATEDEAARRSRHHEVALPSSGLFGNVDTTSFRFTRKMTASDVVDLMATYSGVITARSADRTVGLARVRAALDERFPWAEEIDVPMRARCWRADRTDRAG
jgi:SAM-dependent methyltransferase